VTVRCVGMVAADERVIRDVVGIKTELNQNLCDPEVVGSGVESAIQRVPSQICSSEAILYQRPETVTREGFPNQRKSESMLAFERSGIDGNGGIDHPR